MSSVTRGLYALVRPMVNAPLGVLDLQQGKIFRASRTDATDIYDNVLVSERLNGEIALYHVHEEKPFATTVLPRGALARLSGFAVESDASKVAMSNSSRGGVWDAATGKQLINTPGFRGSFFADEGIYFDFAPHNQFHLIPKQGETYKDALVREGQEPGDVVMHVNLASHATREIISNQKRTRVRQCGTITLSWTPTDDSVPDRQIKLEARDDQTRKVVWTRTFDKDFPKIHSYGSSDTVVLTWRMDTKGAKEELEDDTETRVKYMKCMTKRELISLRLWTFIRDNL